MPEPEVVVVLEVVEQGMLTIDARPSAEVLIDGEAVGMTPLSEHEASAGPHTVTLVAETGERTSFTVEVPAGGVVERSWSFEEDGWLAP
ncbi:MAG: hypothetical protein ACI8S6_005543 [Myxococcota bacterium]